MTPRVFARIAGHSSITVTQRYVHPQVNAINRVFAASQFPVGIKLGIIKKLPNPEHPPGAKPGGF